MARAAPTLERCGLGVFRELSNRPFSEKRRLFKVSNLAINSEIAEEAEWGPEVGKDISLTRQGRRTARRNPSFETQRPSPVAVPVPRGCAVAPRSGRLSHHPRSAAAAAISLCAIRHVGRPPCGPRPRRVAVTLPRTNPAHQRQPERCPLCRRLLKVSCRSTPCALAYPERRQCAVIVRLSARTHTIALCPGPRRLSTADAPRSYLAGAKLDGWWMMVVLI